MGAKRLSALTILALLAACGQGARTSGPATPAASAQPSPAAFTPAVENASAATLAAAFQAAFPGPAPFTQHIPAASDGSSMDHDLQFTPAALIELAPDLVALVSKGEGTNTNYTCEACAGEVAVDYLRRDAAGFSHVAHYDLQGGARREGTTSPWILRNDIDSVPVLMFTNDEAEQGCSSTVTSFVELTPAGAVDAGGVILNSGRQKQDGAVTPGDYTYNGTLAPLVKGQSFVVTYTGSANIRLVFTKGADGKFHPPGGGFQTSPPAC